MDYLLALGRELSVEPVAFLLSERLPWVDGGRGHAKQDAMSVVAELVACLASKQLVEI